MESDFEAIIYQALNKTAALKHDTPVKNASREDMCHLYFKRIFLVLNYFS